MVATSCRRVPPPRTHRALASSTASSLTGLVPFIISLLACIRCTSRAALKCTHPRSNSERLPSPRTLAARVQRGAPAALVTNNGGSQIVYDASIVELPRSIVHPNYGDTHATDSSPATPRPGLASDAASASPGRGGSTTGADGGQGEGAGPHAEVEADRAPPGRAANEASSRAPDAGDVVSDIVHDAGNANAPAAVIGSGGDTERVDADKQLPGMQEGTGSLYVSQGGAEEAEARLVSGDELQAPVLPGAALVAAA